MRWSFVKVAEPNQATFCIGEEDFFSEVVDGVYKSGFELSNDKFGQVTHRFFIHYNYQPLPDERRLQRTSANRPPPPQSRLVLPKMAFFAQNIQYFQCNMQHIICDSVFFA